MKLSLIESVLTTGSDLYRSFSGSILRTTLDRIAFAIGHFLYHVREYNFSLCEEIFYFIFFFIRITLAAILNKWNGGTEGHRKLNRFQVHRKDERILRFDFRRCSKSELQSRNPAFLLGKAEDYGNGYDGEIVEREKTRQSTYEHTYLAESTSFSIHELGQGRKSPVGIRINIHTLFAELFGKSELINIKRFE